MSRQMYHRNSVKTTVSSKIRQNVGVCIIMNNQEKNTYVRTQLLSTLMDMMKNGKIMSIMKDRNIMTKNGTILMKGLRTDLVN